MQNFMSERPQQGGGQRFDREGLFRWAAQRLGTALAARAGGPDALSDQAGFFNAAYKAIEAEGLTEEVFRTEPRSKLREMLLAASAKVMPAADVDAVDATLE